MADTEQLPNECAVCSTPCVEMYCSEHCYLVGTGLGFVCPMCSKACRKDAVTSKQFCGRACANAARLVPPITVPCEACKKPVVIKGRYVAIYKQSKKAYCDSACVRAHRYRRNGETPLDVLKRLDEKRVRLEETRQEKRCTVCDAILPVRHYSPPYVCTPCLAARVCCDCGVPLASLKKKTKRCHTCNVKAITKAQSERSKEGLPTTTFCGTCGAVEIPVRDNTEDKRRDFKKTGVLFCSQKCASTKKTKHVAAACDKCGKQYELSTKQRWEYRKFGRKYCSRECGVAAIREKALKKSKLNENTTTKP